jgi:hypothetical protein
MAQACWPAPGQIIGAEFELPARRGLGRRAEAYQPTGGEPDVHPVVGALLAASAVQFVL